MLIHFHKCVSYVSKPICSANWKPRLKCKPINNKNDIYYKTIAHRLVYCGDKTRQSPLLQAS